MPLSYRKRGEAKCFLLTETNGCHGSCAIFLFYCCFFCRPEMLFERGDCTYIYSVVKLGADITVLSETRVNSSQGVNSGHNLEKYFSKPRQFLQLTCYYKTKLKGCWHFNKIILTLFQWRRAAMTRTKTTHWGGWLLWTNKVNPLFFDSLRAVIIVRIGSM